MLNQRRSVAAFQCSSASRKFLNLAIGVTLGARMLFQCSSASRKFLNLCQHDRRALKYVVSVLFSEPKIPQSASTSDSGTHIGCFSALQRAENSSM